MLGKLPNFFISPEIKDNPTEFVRSRILIKFILICFFAAIFFITLAYLLEIKLTFYALIVLESILITFLAISRKIKSTKVFLRFFLSVIYLAYLFPIIDTGGMNSAVLPQLIVVPMLGFLYGSKPEGIFFAGFSFVTILVFWFLPQMGINLEHNVIDKYERIYDYINYIFLFVFVLVLTMATEEEVETTNKMLKDSNEELLVTQKELREKADYSSRAQAILEKALEKEKRSKDQLKNAQAQLVHNEKMAFIGQLTAGIAHEINNPVNFIKSGIDALIQDISDIRSLRQIELESFESIVAGKEKGDIQDSSEVIQKAMNRIQSKKEEIEFDYLITEIESLMGSIQNGVGRTAEIINGLRVYSRLDQGEYKTSDINENIDATLVLLSNKYKNRIEVIKNYSEIPKVQCISGKISQVFMNLLDNAIQAIEEKGRIEIATTLNEADNTVTISIKDSGTGIPEENANKIFDPFYTTKEVGEGTGLGLAISKGIIDDHQGVLQFESSDSGTTFYVTIPINQK